MRRLGILGVVLGAMLAISAVGAGAALALPEYIGPTPNTITAAGGPAELTVAGEPAIKCATSGATGTFASSPTMLFLVANGIKFTKCETVVFGIKGPCHSTTPAGGTEEIVTLAIHGELGRVKGAGVYVLLKPDSGAHFTTFECSVAGVKETIVVTGEIVGELTGPFNMKTGGPFTLNFAVPKEGEQAIQEFELLTGNMTGVHLLASVNGGAAKAAAEKAASSITTNLEGEIKS